MACEVRIGEVALASLGSAVPCVAPQQLRRRTHLHSPSRSTEQALGSVKVSSRRCQELVRDVCSAVATAKECERGSGFMSSLSPAEMSSSKVESNECADEIAQHAA